MRRFILALLLVTALGWAATATACTFFTKTVNGITLVGNSEDYFEADTCAVFLPPEKGKHGRVYFGWTHVWLQGGVNDQGLAYDIMALSPKEYVKPPAGRKHIPGRLGLLCKIMEECATVEEALKLVNTHVNPLSGGGNLMLADKTGDSAIVEGYTVYRRNGPYQICTNFRWAKVQHNNWRDNRYKAAEALLKDCPVTVDAFRTILTAVHAPLKNNTHGTLYSNIYDLANNRIHLYLLHDFDRAHVIDMKQEFARGPHVVRLSDYWLMLANGRLQLHCKGKNAVLLVPGALTPDRWYHVAFRQDLDAGRLAVFMDGSELLSTMLHATPATNNSPLRLGHSEIQHQASFTGAMDELRIYSRALSDAEIQDLAGE